VMEGGLVSPVDEGTPRGGPLSPLLSNIVLDEFDRELKRRGFRFARLRTTAIPMSAAVGRGTSDGEHNAIRHDGAQGQ